MVFSETPTRLAISAIVSSPAATSSAAASLDGFHQDSELRHGSASGSCWESDGLDSSRDESGLTSTSHLSGRRAGLHPKISFSPELRRRRIPTVLGQCFTDAINPVGRSWARAESTVQSAPTIRHRRPLARFAPAGLRSAARRDMRISGLIPVSQPAAPPLLSSVFSSYSIVVGVGFTSALGWE